MTLEQDQLAKELVAVANAKVDEAQGNVQLLCNDCTAKIYPRRGQFTIDEVHVGGFVKVMYPGMDGRREHIWVQVTSKRGDLIYGTLANEPVIIPGRFGDKVSLTLKQVEDVGLE
jgi:uncharacterized protein YegJ (DUF2314 family)